MSRRDYANSRPTNGTRSFSRAPGWSDLGWIQVARESSLKKANFLRRCFPGKFLFRPVDRASSRCRSVQETNNSERSSMRSTILMRGWLCGRSASFCACWMRIVISRWECSPLSMDRSWKFADRFSILERQHHGRVLCKGRARTQRSWRRNCWSRFEHQPPPKGYGLASEHEQEHE